MAAHKAEIEAAPDPAAKRAELEAFYLNMTSPFRTAEKFGMLDIIDPRETGALSCATGSRTPGGRAACVVAALWPERCAGLVSFNSYNIQDIARAMTPEVPANEHSLWYQYYFHSERGRRGLAQDRRGLCRLLWRLWSPTWRFDDATFERSAAAFDNPDFVDVVIQSYRHRFGLVAGDPARGRRGSGAGPAAAHHRAHAHLRRRRRRRAPAGRAVTARPSLHRAAHAHRGAGRGAQHAAGGAGGVCTGGDELGAGRLTRSACCPASIHVRRNNVH
jgi:hypothetical protein